METTIERQVIDIFHTHTLHPKSLLVPESHLERELGIDSIVLQSIIEDVHRKFGLPQDSVRRTECQTLRDVLDRVQRASSQVSAPVPRAPAARDIKQMVVDIVARHTRYPEEALRLDAEFEAELGIDSVILQAIVADVMRAVPGAPSTVDMRRLNNIGALIDAMNPKAAAEQPPRVAPRAPAAAPPQPRVDQGKPSPVKNLAVDERLPAAVAVSTSAPRVAEPNADLRKQIVDVLGIPESDAAANVPFGALGLSAVARERVLGAVQRKLSVAPTLKLAECDTVEKLADYVAAARHYAVVPLDEHASSAAPATIEQDEDTRTMKDFVEKRSPDLFAKVREFGSFYQKRQRDNLYWYGMPLETPCRNRAIIYDEVSGRRREFLMFASNNYLGLANHPKVLDAIADTVKQYGSTNTGCRLIGGTNLLHKELERRLARFKGTEAAIIYPSGYSANLGCISALAKSSDAVILDKYNHMSIVDGAKLSGAQRRIYAHDDMADLERVLEACAGRVDGKLIVTDGVFSMHGNICNLPEIVRLARKYDARVLVDDAHATGVLGRRGSGTAEHFGLCGGTDVDLEVGTMSKTLAGLGGFVCGNEDVIEYLRFYSNSYVFAANIPAAVAAGLIASIDVMETEPQRIATLWKNIRYLKEQLDALGFDTGGANSAIVPIVISDDRKTLEMGRAVRARGLFCQTVVYPGVSVGDARLRISVTSEHTREDLDLALDIFVASAKEVGVSMAKRG